MTPTIWLTNTMCQPPVSALESVDRSTRSTIRRNTAAAHAFEGAGFAEPSVVSLASLSGGPQHGYALIKDIEEIAGVTLGPGTLYGALTLAAPSLGDRW
jgi:hypothetical protein